MNQVKPPIYRTELMTASNEKTISFNHPNTCSNDRHVCNSGTKFRKRTEHEHLGDQHDWWNKHDKLHNGREYDKLWQHDNFIGFDVWKIESVLLTSVP